MKRRIECYLKGVRGRCGSFRIGPVRLCGVIFGLCLLGIMLFYAVGSAHAVCRVNMLPLTNMADYRDSLSMEVLRKGHLRITYYSYFQANSVVLKETVRNAVQLNKLDAFFDVILEDSLVAFGKAEITGTASVEGSYVSNEALARQRGQAFSRFLEQRYKLSSRLPVAVNWIAEDWALLEHCVQNDSTPLIVPWKKEILQIIRQTPIHDGREALLLKLGGGVPYQYMKTHFFPRQRRGIIAMTYDMKGALQKQYKQELSDSVAERIVANSFLTPADAQRFVSDTTISILPISAQQPDSICEESWCIPVVNNEIPASYILTRQSRLKDVLSKAMTVIDNANKLIEDAGDPQPPAPEVALPASRVVTVNHRDTVYIHDVRTESFPFCVIVKTNLLALGGITPEPALRAPMGNLELELVFSRRLSFSISGLYASSYSVSDYRLWSATAYTGEIRYKVLPVHRYSGLYAGLYVRGGDFDIQKKSTTTDATVNPYDTGRYYEAGLSAGYSLFITPRWAIEAVTSCGFRHKRYTPYRDGSSGQYATGVRSSKTGFDLTGLSVSVGYVIGKRK